MTDTSPTLTPLASPTVNGALSLISDVSSIPSPTLMPLTYPKFNGALSLISDFSSIQEVIDVSSIPINIVPSPTVDDVNFKQVKYEWQK